MVGLAGQPVTVGLGVPLVISCPGGNPVAASVTTEVLDPAGQAVDHQRAGPSSSNTLGYGASVSFTPVVPGRYHLTATFEPALGRAPADVVVMRDVGEPPLVDMSIDGRCTPWVVSEHLVVCDVGGNSVVTRDGADVGFLGALSATAWVPPWLWVVRSNRVERWEDTGAGPLTLHESAAWPGAFFAFNADATHAWLASSDHLDELSVANGALTVSRSLAARGLGPASGGALLSLADGSFSVATGAQLCHVTSAAVSCVTPGAKNAQGVLDGAGFWFGADYVHVTTEGSAAFEETDAPSAGLSALSSPIPLYVWEDRVVGVALPDFSLSAYLAKAPIHGALPGVVWFRTEVAAGQRARLWAWRR